MIIGRNLKIVHSLLTRRGAVVLSAVCASTLISCSDSGSSHKTSREPAPVLPELFPNTESSDPAKKIDLISISAGLNKNYQPGDTALCSGFASLREGDVNFTYNDESMYLFRWIWRSDESAEEQDLTIDTRSVKITDKLSSGFLRCQIGFNLDGHKKYAFSDWAMLSASAPVNPPAVEPDPPEEAPVLELRPFSAALNRNLYNNEGDIAFCTGSTQALDGSEHGISYTYKWFYQINYSDTTRHDVAYFDPFLFIHIYDNMPHFIGCEISAQKISEDGITRGPIVVASSSLSVMGNRPPQVFSSSIVMADDNSEPVQLKTGQSVSCATSSIIDPDEDLFTVSYSWFYTESSIGLNKRKISDSKILDLTPSLVRGYLSCAALAVDSFGAERSSSESASFYIDNSAPNAFTSELDKANYSSMGEEIRCIKTLKDNKIDADPDLDTIVYYYHWFLIDENAVETEYTGLGSGLSSDGIIYALTDINHYQIYCRIAAFDGFGGEFLSAPSQVSTINFPN
jgi:hypothetical protein